MKCSKAEKISKQVCIAIVMMVMVCVPTSSSVQALTLGSRSVAVGDSKQGATTSHTFKFSIPSYGQIGSIQFEYCENTPFAGTTCDAPAGLSTSNVVLVEQSGETDFTAEAPNDHSIVINRTSAATSGAPVSYTFNNIVNPSEANKTVYVRISTFVDSDAVGPRVDTGAVVYATARNIAVNGYVPPYLIFCVGVTVEMDCSSASGSLLNFGELSASQTRALSSQYSGSTNDPGGFTTAVAGITMTSGNNTIPALDAQDISRPGTGQFGINLRANSSPAIGKDPEGQGGSAPLGNFATPNRFYFDNQVISGSTTATDYKRFTTSYIVNIPPKQRAGVYSSTLTFTAVAAF